MTLIDGDRIITAKLYDDEHEEFIEKKMSIIDCMNAYTDEGVTEADVVEQPRWIPVSERLPNECSGVLVYCPKNDNIFLAYLEIGKWYIFSPRCDEPIDEPIAAWMPLPESYKAESEVQK